MSTLQRLLFISFVLTVTACMDRRPPQRDDDSLLSFPALPDSARGTDNSFIERDVIRGIMQHSFSQIGEDVDPELAPDGRLYYASTHQTKRFDIFYKEKNSARIVQKTFNPWDDRSPKVSPDGRWIVFVSNRRGNWDLYMVSSDNSNKETRLTDDASDEIHPSWSPDGRMIAYSARNARSGRWEVKVLDMRTMSTMVLEGIEGLFPEWSPDGKKFVFQRSRSRRPQWYAIWTINVDGSELTELVSSPDWAAINPSWTLDGKHVVFSTVAKSPEQRGKEKTADDIWIVDSRGTGLTRLTAGLEAEWDPTVAADGRVYFCSTRAGHKNIWSAELNLLDITHMEPSHGKVLPVVQVGGHPTTSRRTEPLDAAARAQLVDDFDLLNELDTLKNEESK